MRLLWETKGERASADDPQEAGVGAVADKTFGRSGGNQMSGQRQPTSRFVLHVLLDGLTAGHRVLAELLDDLVPRAVVAASIAPHHVMHDGLLLLTEVGQQRAEQLELPARLLFVGVFGGLYLFLGVGESGPLGVCDIV